MASKKKFLRKGENLAKRSERYARELKSGKSEITGKPLTQGQRTFRGGVLNERSISAEQYKHNAANKPKRGRRKSTSPKVGAYNAFGKVNENLVDDRNGAVVFFDGGKLPF